MIRTEETTIGGHTYRVQQMPGMAAYKMLNRLARMLAPGLSMLTGQKPGSSLGDLDLGVVADALPKMLAELSEEEQERLTRKLLEQTLADGKPLMPSFDLHFGGRPLDAVKLVVFALQLNFGSFRDALAASGIGRATGATPSSETSSTSAGQVSA